MIRLEKFEELLQKGPACDSHDCSSPKGQARDCKWGWECQAWVNACTNPLAATIKKEPKMDRWIVAKECVVSNIGDHPLLGYMVIYAWGTFATHDEAYDHIKKHNLPIGWVIMHQSQLHMGTSYATNKISPK